MRNAKPVKVWIGGAAALALACAAVMARSGTFGIAPDGKRIAGLLSNRSPAGAHRP